VWFIISTDGGAISSREEVRELADQFEFPAEALTRDSKIHAFVRACKVQTTYEANGRVQVIRGKEAKRTTEFITVHVMNEDGLKLAEYKFFQSRRNRTGLVRGSHVVRSMLRANLTDEQREAARAWLAAAAQLYEQYSGEAPLSAVRRLTRLAMLDKAVPIIERESMYFVYGDEIEVAYRVRAFLAATLSTPPTVTILGVDDYSDYQVFADSSDHFLAAQLDVIIERIQRALARGVMVALDRRAAWNEAIERTRNQTERHERRLRLRLPRTRSTLLLADHLVSELPVHPACRQ
jgi:hypothetical protein